jgi:hypothetical protein
LIYSFINPFTKFGYWAAEAAKKFRHKEMLSIIATDTIYSVASLPLLPKAGLSSIINFLTIKN